MSSELCLRTSAHSCVNYYLIYNCFINLYLSVRPVVLLQQANLPWPFLRMLHPLLTSCTIFERADSLLWSEERGTTYPANRSTK